MSRSATRCRPSRGGGWRWTGGRCTRTTVAASERYNTRLEALLTRAARAPVRRPRPRHGGDAGKRAVREIVGDRRRADRRLWSQTAQRDRHPPRRPSGAVSGRSRPPAVRGGVDRAGPAGQPGDPAAQARTPLPRRAARRLARRSPHRARRCETADDGCCATSYPTRHPRREDRRRAVSRPSGSRRRRPSWPDRAGRRARPGRRRHLRAEAERQVRTAAQSPAERLDATRRRLGRRRPGSVRSDCAWTTPVDRTAAAAPRGTATSVYDRAGAQLYTSRDILAAEQAIWSRPPRIAVDDRCARAPSVDIALLEATPTASASTRARSRWSASWPAPARGCSSRSPRPGPARPPRCGSWPGPGAGSGGTTPSARAGPFRRRGRGAARGDSASTPTPWPNLHTLNVLDNTAVSLSDAGLPAGWPRSGRAVW